MYVAVNDPTCPENYPLQTAADYIKTGNIRIKNFTLRLFRETVAAVEKQLVLHILGVCR